MHQHWRKGPHSGLDNGAREGTLEKEQIVGKVDEFSLGQVELFMGHCSEEVWQTVRYNSVPFRKSWVEMMLGTGQHIYGK